jgi:hypothetical protein
MATRAPAMSAARATARPSSAHDGVDDAYRIIRGKGNARN